jgi:YjbE family integral membrane protein
MEEILYNATFISILQIIAIDIILGGDNAIVIALACKNLPENKRKLGIFYGAMGAIILRVIMVFFATSLLMISGLKIAGGILLLWIGAKLILDNNKENIINVSQEKNLIGAIRTIIIADFVMSLDNSVAIAAAADGNMYLVLFGLLLSIPIIIWGSSFILKLIDKFPIIIYLGSALLGWIAGDMILTDIFIAENFKGISNHNILPILGSLSVLTFCFLYKIIKK